LQIALPGTRIMYKLGTHSKLSKLLQSTPVLRPNELVSASENVSGLDIQKYRMPDARGTVKAPCLGGTVSGTKKAWYVSPVLRPKMAPTAKLEFSSIVINIPEREEYERSLLSSLSDGMPSEEIYREETTIFGGKKLRKQQEAKDDKSRAKIIERKLKFGLHNGRTLLGKGWNEIELEEGEDDDQLLSMESKYAMKNFYKQENCAIVSILEYVIRPAHASVKGHSQEVRSGKTTTAENYTVVIGAQAYTPFDGKILRLRNTEKKSNDKNAVDLALLCDARARIFTTDHIFNPRDRDDGEEEVDRVKVRFNLKGYDRKGKELKDETPANDDDESEDEDGEIGGDSDAEDKSVVSDAESRASTTFSTSSEEDESSSEDISEEDVKESKKPKKKPKKKKKKKKKKHKKKHDDDSDDDSDLESSIVSGDSFSNFLVLRTGASNRRSASFGRKHKKLTKGKNRKSLNDAQPLTSIQEEDWDGWRQGIHVPREKSGVAGAALTAPIHYSSTVHQNSGGGFEAGYTTNNYNPHSTAGAMGGQPLSNELSRAQRSRLGRHGFFEKVVEEYNDVNAADGDSHSIDKELNDEKLRHEITLQFAAFNACEKKAPLPTSVYFTFQLYDRQPTRTERLVLRESHRKDASDHTVSRVLCREKVGRSSTEYSPSKTLKFSFDLSLMGLSEAKNYASYLQSKSLYVDVWDADALMHIGTIGIPLKKLMRQGKRHVKVARTYDVVTPRGLAEDGGALGVRPGSIGGGPVVGQVQVLMANFGETGKGGNTVGGGVSDEIVLENNGTISGELNWRTNTLSASMSALSTRRGGNGTARHKVRARPLSESNKDLKKMIKSFGVDGGDLGASNGRRSMRGAEDAETVTYDELMKLCKRFRASEKGRINYKTSGLMELLDVPNVARLEKRLVRLLTLAEDQGTSLDEAFNYLDSDKDKEITASDLEEGLRRLKAFDGMRRDEIAILCGKFPRNENGMIGRSEFIHWVREKQPKSAEEDKLRKILKKAEAMGKSVEDIFGFFDRDASGEITLAEFRDGLSQLGPFSRLTNKEFKSLTKKFDSDGNGKVSLFEFMTFMGKKYDPVESAKSKLKAILLKAETMGTSLSKAFAHFDSDGSGEIRIDEFTEGLSSLGVFSDLTNKQVQDVLKEFDKNSDGTVSLTEFMSFMGRDYVADVEAKLRKILAKAVGMGTTIEECFGHFDTDGDGKINASDMEIGMKSLGQFEQVGQEEVEELMRRFDDDNDGMITESEFISAFGTKKARRRKDTGEGDESAVAPLTLVQKRVLELFTKAEKNGTSLSSLFKSINKDETSDMTYSEFGDALRSLGGNFGELSNSETDELCESYDKDKNKVISLKEFKSWIREKQNELKESVKEATMNEEEKVAEAEWTVASLYGICKKLSGDQTLQDFANGRESISYAAWVKALGDMMQSSSCFKVFEAKDLAGQDCQDVLRRGFKDGDGGGSQEADIHVRTFTNWFDNKIKGARNQDKQIKAEAVSLAKLVISNALDLGKGDEVGLEEALKILQGADVRLRGKGVSKVFSVLEKGAYQKTTTLTKQVVEVFDFCSIRATEGEVKSLVARGGKSGSTEVNVATFFEFLCNGAVNSDSKATAAEEEKEEEGLEDEGEEDELDVADKEAPYKFSSDPDIRESEKKLRRSCMKKIHQGVVDLDEMFGRFDASNNGTIMRSDFVQVLMELGLSLLDGGGVSDENDANSSNKQQRERQLAALSNFKGSSGKRAAKLRDRRPQLFQDRRDGDMDAFNDEKEALNMIKWYREGQKKNVVRNLITQSLTTQYTLCPRFGHTLFFEYELKNPFGSEERFNIVFDDPELRVVTSSDEWMYLRRRVAPAVGSVGEWPIEHDMIDGDGSKGSCYQICLQPNERVSVPFTMLSIDPQNRDGSKGERNLNVQFVSATHGHCTSVLELKIKPKPMIIDRNFRFFQSEGEILKRTVQLLGGGVDERLHDYESDDINGGGDGGHKYVHCVEMNSNRVVVDWRGSAQPGSPQEVMIKYRCGKFPSLGEFYIIVYDDHFQGVVHECWHVVVQSRLRLDVHASVGQSTSSELVIQGDKFARRVQLYCSAAAETDFDPAAPFQLVPGAFNRAAVRFKMRSAGQHKVHIHMVDLDTKELVCAWLVNVTANLPVVTKVYDVQLPVDSVVSKKLSFMNQWDKNRRYNLLSSDEGLMRPRHESVDIAGGAVGYLRLHFHPIEEVGTHEVILFVNDEHDQNEEAFLLKLHVSA